MSDTEFKDDEYGTPTFTDSDGDKIFIVSDNIGEGMDLMVEVYSNGCLGIVRVNARELIAAVQKVAGLDLTIRDNVVYREFFGGNPGHETDTLGTLNAEGVSLAPKPKGESAIALLVELYAEKLKSGASDEDLAVTMARIHREIEVTR